jgi:hypothetical protein
LSIFLIFLFCECKSSVATRGGDKRGVEYIKWTREINGSDILFVGTADLDGDKTQEVIVQAFSNNDVISHVIDSSSGNEKKIISRIVDNGSPEVGYYEFPSYHYYLRGFYLPSIDIDNDGKENWFTLDSYYINISDTKFSLYTLASTMLSGLESPTWSYKISSPINSTDISDLSPFLIPSSVLEGNGGQDFIFTSIVNFFTANNLCVLKGLNGTIKWCKELEDEFNFSVADINGDGIDDIITFIRKKKYGGVYAFNGNNGEVLWTINIDCEEINGSSADMDNDGIVDVVIICGIPSVLKVLNGLNGKENFSVNFSMDSTGVKILYDGIDTSFVPVLGDVDNDGENDVVLQKLESGVKDTNGNGIFGDCVDYNGNGKYEEGECDAGVGENYLFAFNLQKGILWKYKNQPGDIITNLIADVDNDGENEIISNYLDKENIKDFELQVINGNDGTPAFWYGEFKDFMGYSEIKNVKLWGIEDIDSDGMLEMLVSGLGCRDNGCNIPVVMCLRTDASVPEDTSLLPWPFPRHDKYQKNHKK